MSAAQRQPKATVPSTYANLLIDVVARWQVTPEQLLEGSGISSDQLLNPFGHLDYVVFSMLLNRALKLTKELGLGFHLGMQMTVSCHGLIGFAAMIAKDIREALQIAQQFISIQSSVLSLRLEIEHDTAYLYFDYMLTEHSFGEIGPIFLMLGFAMMGQAVSGQQLVGSADVEFERPAYFDDFEHLLPGHLNFSQAQTRMIFPAKFLEIPLVMADPLSARLAREQCKRELNALLKHSNFIGLVYELVYDEALGFSSMQEVAKKLHLSERTLQRKISKEGQSFRMIVDGIKQQKAIILLKRKQLSLEFIAEKLGYMDVTSFSRAFKRWTGKTPSTYKS